MWKKAWDKPRVWGGEGYDTLAEWLDRVYWKQNRKKLHEQMVAKHIPKSNLVLDAGCGSGRYVPILAKDRTYVGVDISSTMLRLAKEKITDEDAHLINGDVEHLPFKKIFPVTINIAVLRHLSSKKAIRVLRNLLNQSDKLVFTVRITNVKRDYPDYFSNPHRIVDHTFHITEIEPCLAGRQHKKIFVPSELSAERKDDQYIFIVDREAPQ